MIRDVLAQTWEEKFENYIVGEEYIYSFQNREQVEKARQAVNTENLKGNRHLKFKSARVHFSIICEEIQTN